jgi:transmembrane sensor
MSTDRRDDIPWDLLHRYLAGDCTPAERETVERLMRPPVALNAPDLDDVWANVRRQRGAPARRQPQPRRGPWRWLAGMAAAALIAAVATTLWRGATQPYREFASAPGGRATITLKDGTRVILGPATHLRVGASARVVDLDGEAQFTVVHDARHPFVVHTSRATVRDIGTTFTVRAYASDRASAVAVEEGEVALGAAHLRARDAAEIDSTGAVTLRHDIEVASYAGWLQGALIFRHTPLKDAVRELARTYDLTVTIADSTLGDKEVTASFSNQPADEVLNVVTHVVGAHFDRAGRSVVIRRGMTTATSLHLTQAH